MMGARTGRLHPSPSFDKAKLVRPVRVQSLRVRFLEQDPPPCVGVLRTRDPTGSTHSRLYRTALHALLTRLARVDMLPACFPSRHGETLQTALDPEIQKDYLSKKVCYPCGRVYRPFDIPLVIARPACGLRLRDERLYHAALLQCDCRTLPNQSGQFPFRFLRGSTCALVGIARRFQLDAETLDQVSLSRGGVASGGRKATAVAGSAGRAGSES